VVFFLIKLAAVQASGAACMKFAVRWFHMDLIYRFTCRVWTEERTAESRRVIALAPTAEAMELATSLAPIFHAI